MLLNAAREGAALAVASMKHDLLASLRQEIAEAIKSAPLSESEQSVLVGIGEICKIMDCGRTKLHTIRSEDARFPAPVSTPGRRTPRWKRSEIVSYAKGQAKAKNCL